ncbi:MAG: hypothetical protein IB617_00140 [Candidatus Nealsonbacteria bacterium]|nr:MAG: hypothetical protein IB617_00140 [Candidatus Nealsonbacteria bacterium]
MEEDFFRVKYLIPQNPDDKKLIEISKEIEEILKDLTNKDLTKDLTNKDLTKDLTFFYKKIVLKFYRVVKRTKGEKKEFSFNETETSILTSRIRELPIEIIVVFAEEYIY